MLNRGMVVSEVFSLAHSKIRYSSWIVCVALNMGLLSPQSVFAYVGPGAGLSVIGTIVALIVAIILAIVGFIWYPFKRILAKLKSSRGPTE
jgi:nitrate reductase gamma subunit